MMFYVIPEASSKEGSGPSLDEEVGLGLSELRASSGRPRG